MKKALLIAVVTIASTSAFASKARKTALASSPHLSDVQDVLTKPDTAVANGEWATFEFGSTPASVAAAPAAANAEGGFVRMMGNSALGAYLGAANATSNGYRILANGTASAPALLGQENPLRLFYATKAGDLNWGAGLFYTTSKNKVDGTADKKQDAMGLTASASMAAWDAQLALGLSNNSSNTVAAGEHKLTGKSSTTLSGGYHLDTMYIYGSYGMSGAKYENTASTAIMDRADSDIKVGVVNSHKKDGTDFFYGIEYGILTKKDDATTPVSIAANTTKSEVTSMPIFVGIEAEATSWMVLRGSFKSTFPLLGLAKTKLSTNNSTDTETSNSANNTVSAGAGVKWNKFTFDSVVAASSSATGTFGTDGANFLTNASLTYVF